MGRAECAASAVTVEEESKHSCGRYEVCFARFFCGLFLDLVGRCVNGSHGSGAVLQQWLHTKNSLCYILKQVLF